MASSRSAARARPLPLAPLLLACFALPAQGVDLVEGKIAHIRGQDWRVAGLAFSLDLGHPSLPGSVRIDLLELTGAGMSFADIDVDCGKIQFTTAELACLDGKVTLDLPGAGRRSFPGEAIYDRKSGATRFDLSDLPVAQGRIELRGSASETALDLEFAGIDLKLADLAELAAAHDVDLRGIVASGAGALSGSLRLRDGALDSLELSAELIDASLSNDSGTLVTDAMHALVDATASNAGGGWQFSIGVTADAGEAYIEPVYAHVGENHLSVTATGRAAPDFADIEFREFTLTQGSLIHAGGNLRIRFGAETAGAMVSGALTLDESSVEAIYAGLLQVVLAGTAAGDLETSGTVSGTVTLADSTVSSLDLALEEVGVDDRQRRFAVHGLNGSLRWPGAGGSAEAAEPSRLQWASAGLYDIPLGAGTIVARIGGNDLQLDEPLRIPTMGGALVLERLRLDN